MGCFLLLLPSCFGLDGIALATCEGGNEKRCLCGKKKKEPAGIISISRLIRSRLKTRAQTSTAVQAYLDSIINEANSMNEKQRKARIDRLLCS